MAKPSIDAKSLVRRSQRAYARAHRGYEKSHGEIFNPTEQGRLLSMLGRAASECRSSVTAKPVGLDLGCGTGNLTRHLLSLGFEVVAADVSPHFLTEMTHRYPDRGDLSTHQLDGVSLDGLAAERFDLVGVYSVLHHIPDYLAIIDECSRVLRRGGILMLDHEHNDHHWSDDAALKAFRRELRQSLAAQGGRWNPAVHKWQRALLPPTYVTKARLMRNPNYFRDREGDIHTKPDDHIEWNLVEQRALQAGLELVARDDYLLCRAHYPPAVYAAWRDRCSDTTAMIFRKR